MYSENIFALFSSWTAALLKNCPEPCLIQHPILPPINLMVRFFHVVEIVGTTCDGVLITSRLVVTTRDSWKSRRHDFHDLESRDAEITWLSREHEQTTQKWRLKRPDTRVLHQYCTSQHGKVQLRNALQCLDASHCTYEHAHALLRTTWLKHTRLVPTSSQVVPTISTTWKERTISPSLLWITRCTPRPHWSVSGLGVYWQRISGAPDDSVHTLHHA